MQFNTIFW